MALFEQQHAPAQPSPEHAQPTPEELFAAHVESVRISGDAFDERTAHTSLQAIKYGLPMASGPTLAVTEMAAFGDTLKLAAVSSIASGIYVAKTVFANRGDQKRALEKFGAETQEANNAYYELYRTKNDGGGHDVVMKWQGPITNENEASPEQELQRIAQLAADNNVAQMLVPRSILPHYQHGVPRNNGIVGMAEWLADNKSRTFTGISIDEVYNETPGHWLEYLEDPDLGYDVSIVRTDRERIGEMSPHHAGLQAVIGRTLLRMSAKTELHVQVPATPENWDAAKVRVIVKPIHTVIPALPQYSVQGDIAAKYLRPGTKRYRRAELQNKSGRVIAAAAIAASVLAIGGNVALDKHMDRVDAQAAAEIAVENGLNPAVAEIDPKFVRARVDGQSTVNRIANGWRDVRDTIHDTSFLALRSDAHKSGTGKQQGTPIPGTQLEGVGNIGKPVDVVNWQLLPHNLPNSALSGHWTVDTSSKLQGSIADGSKPNLEWVMHSVETSDGLLTSDIADAIERPVPTTLGYSKKKSIEVTGDIQRVSTNGDSAVAPYTADIPVREGYKVSAANIGGQKVTVLKKKDNTFVLGSDKEIALGSDAQYWITPDATRKVRAQQPTFEQTLITNSSQAERNFFDNQKITAKFNTYMPGVTTDKEAENFMRNNLGYSYNPWPEDRLSMKNPAADTLIDITFQEKKAVCNVAATMMVMRNTNLNFVAEYRNDTGRTLSSKEAHARAVDGSGQVFDATPLDTSALLQKAEKPAPVPLPIGPIVLGLGLLAAATTGYKRRRQLQTAVQVATSTYADIANTAADRLHGATLIGLAPALRGAVQAAEHAPWSGPDVQISPATLDTARHDTGVSALQAARNLLAPDSHDPDVRTQVAAQQAVTPLEQAVLEEVATLVGDGQQAPANHGTNAKTILTKAQRRAIKYAAQGGSRYAARHRA